LGFEKDPFLAGRRSRFSSRSWIIVEVEALEFLVVAAGVLSEIKFSGQKYFGQKNFSV